MKRVAVCLGVTVVVLAAGLLLFGRRPLLPNMQDPLGLMPVVPGESRSVAELERAMTSPEASIRREALRSLGRAMDHSRLKPEVVVPVLLGRAKDADPSVRAVATAYLRSSEVDPAVAVPALIDLMKDSDPSVRANAAIGLQYVSRTDPAAQSTLAGAWNDPSMEVRRQIPLGMFWHPESRYELPEKWRGLSKEDAKGILRSMGLYESPECLWDAVHYNDIVGVILLLAAGVDPNATARPGEKEPPLFTVGPSTRPEIVKALLDHGADPHARDKGGRTPLGFAEFRTGGQDPRLPSFFEENLKLLAAATNGDR